MTVPAAMPSPMERTMARASLPRLGRTSVRKAGPIHVSTKAPRIVRGPGKNRLGATADQIVHTATRARGSPIA
jgi:hypothetical protein